MKEHVSEPATLHVTKEVADRDWLVVIVEFDVDVAPCGAELSVGACMGRQTRHRQHQESETGNHAIILRYRANASSFRRK